MIKFRHYVSINRIGRHFRRFVDCGGISANKKQRKADQILSDRERNLKEWYNSEMNMPYLDRADSRAMLKRIRDYNEDELKAMNTNAVKSGATDDAKVAAANKAQQKLFADPRPDRGAWRTAQRSSAAATIKPAWTTLQGRAIKRNLARPQARRI